MSKYNSRIIALFFIYGCANNNSTKENLEDSNKERHFSLTDQKKLPFIGKRIFETRLGVSGTGTPHRQVEIKNDGFVIFSFVQINQADKTITKGVYNAGPFTNIMKCVFKDWYNEIRFYKMTPDKIYEVDSNGNLLKLNECCKEIESIDCSCESEYDTLYN